MHTPGPWRVDTDDDNEDHPGMHPVVRGWDGNKCVADVGNGEDWEKAKPEWLANARLIAAAPDLLDALDELLSSVRAHNEANGQQMIDLHSERSAEAALAKARGETVN